MEEKMNEEQSLEDGQRCGRIVTSDVHERYKLCGVLWNKGADKHERRI